MTAAAAQESLFAVCPLPGCKNPVEDPRCPCGDCLAAFGDRLRPVEAGVSAEEYAAKIADRDVAVQAVFAERHTFAPLPEPQPDPEADVEWRRNQTCWCCDDRRTCRLDPDHPERWICKSCEAIT